jgi:hypothetical protein
MYRTDKSCEWPLDKSHWELCGKPAVEKRDVLACKLGQKSTFVGVWLCRDHLEHLRNQIVPKH